MNAPDRTAMPRPLLLHLLSLAAGTAPSGAAMAAGQKLPPEALAAIDRTARRQMDEAMRGIELYRSHPAHRPACSRPVMAAEGVTRVLDCAPDAGENSPSVLIIPSMVNSADILDIEDGQSLVTAMAQADLRPRLLDWGSPTELEAGFGLSDVICGRLHRLIAEVTRQDGQPPILLGYCMGGVLALGAALTLPPGCIPALALLASPWDFHADAEMAAQSRRVAALLGPLCALLPPNTPLPADVVQSLFWMLDPMTGLHKFRRFAGLAQDGDTARRFVLLEDWLNSPQPLPGPIARACISDWYGHNQLATGRWVLNGQPVIPAALPCPSLCIIPAQDRIVPAASAKGLADILPDNTTLAPDLGHIGLITSRRTPQAVWAALFDWLKSID